MRKETMAAELKAAREITAKADAERRDLTQTEVDQVNEHIKAFNAAKTDSSPTSWGASSDVKEALAAIGFDLGLDGDSGTSHPVKAIKTPRSLTWAEKVASSIDSMGKRAGVPDGQKALITGSISVPSLLDQGRPATIDTPTTTVLDLIGRGAPSGTREGSGFTYLRQTARTNNAAAVADLGVKPTSTYSFGEVADHFRVFANKTEAFPYRYLTDHQAITEIVRSQLAEDTILAIEADVLNGTGSGEEFTGILSTAGLQLQAFDTDPLTTLISAKYKLLAQELPFNGWVLNPADVQQLELLREGGTTGPFLFGSADAIAARLGAPFAISTGIPAGTALVGDFTEAELIPLGDDELVVDTTQRTVDNSILFMFEGRYGFRVKKPVRFVKADLTAL